MLPKRITYPKLKIVSTDPTMVEERKVAPKDRSTITSPIADKPPQGSHTEFISIPRSSHKEVHLRRIAAEEAAY